MWDLWRTKWHWGIISRCRLFRFLLPIPILLNAEFLSFGDGTMGPPADQSTQGLSLIPPKGGYHCYATEIVSETQLSSDWFNPQTYRTLVRTIQCSPYNPFISIISISTNFYSIILRKYSLQTSCHVYNCWYTKFRHTESVLPKPISKYASVITRKDRNVDDLYFVKMITVIYFHINAQTLH
jgi:hypothetical protein